MLAANGLVVPPFLLLLWLKFKVVSGVRRVLRPRVNIAMLPHISQHRASIAYGSRRANVSASGSSSQL